jgi:hypothetical protein
MRVFACQACGNLLYFENTSCERCGHVLGYLPDRGTLSAMEPGDGDVWSALGADGASYRFCRNGADGVCNWMIPDSDDHCFCVACRHNLTIPDLSVPENAAAWVKLETAKHRLFYALLHLQLPLDARTRNGTRSLTFAFLGEAGPDGKPVMTGHDNGLITLSAKEADDAERERVRGAMGESYRTLLGHFRHESGHYYWDALVRDGGRLDGFRAVFGDERLSYEETLRTHYEYGPPADWRDRFVSAYASMHPWEDFAESWAHYLHIIDTLETARVFGVTVQGQPGMQHKPGVEIDFDPYHASHIDQLIAAWLPLCFAVNSINRSMGQPDLYPFVLNQTAIAKLAYVHDLIQTSAARHPGE